MLTRSESLNEIFAALAKAQAEIGIAGEKSENPHFKSKFSDLTELVRVSRPALTKHGLSVIHQVLPDATGEHYMHAILCHSSGQYIETRIRIVPARPDIQSLGACITYLRRYTYAAIVGVVSSGEDDDGESQMQDARKNPNNHSSSNYNTPSYQSVIAAPAVITKEQLEQLDYELKDHPDIVASILDKKRINSLRDIPKSEFMAVLTRVREIKQTKQG